MIIIRKYLNNCILKHIFLFLLLLIIFSSLIYIKGINFNNIHESIGYIIIYFALVSSSVYFIFNVFALIKEKNLYNTSANDIEKINIETINDKYYSITFKFKSNHSLNILTEIPFAQKYLFNTQIRKQNNIPLGTPNEIFDNLITTQS